MTKQDIFSAACEAATHKRFDMKWLYLNFGAPREFILTAANSGGV
jgi:hypothetical protein